jgi:hypothetical protein
MQERFIERRHIIDSFKLDQKFTGVLQPGRYRGFDTIKDISGLTFSVGHHGATGIKHYSRDNHTESNPKGVWLSTQGVTITEDEDIGPFTVDTNAGFTELRFDLLVGSHEYSDTVTGGNIATYSIIKGTPGAGLPALVDSTRQVVLAVITMKPGQTSLTNESFNYEKPPGLGNTKLLYEDKPNNLKASLNQAQGDIVVPTRSVGSDFSVDHLILGEDGNIFEVDTSGNALTTYIKGISYRQPGTVIWLKVTDSTPLEIQDSASLSTSDIVLGLAPVTSGFSNKWEITQEYWYQFMSVRKPSGEVVWLLTGKTGIPEFEIIISSIVNNHTTAIDDINNSLPNKVNKPANIKVFQQVGSLVTSNFGIAQGANVNYRKDALDRVQLFGVIEVIKLRTKLRAIIHLTIKLPPTPRSILLYSSYSWPSRPKHKSKCFNRRSYSIHGRDKFTSSKR